MGSSIHRWPHVGRALRRASVQPLFIGLLTFSLALVAVGVVVYAGAVPSLAAHSPLLARMYGGNAALFGPDAPLYGVARDDAVHAGAGAAGADPLVPAGGTAAPGQGAGGAAGSVVVAGGAPNLIGGETTGPVIGDDAGPTAFPPADSGGNPAASAAGGGASSSGGGDAAGSGNAGDSGNAGGSGGSGGGAGGSGGSGNSPAPSEPDPDPVVPVEMGGPVPEDMELRIRDTLRKEYEVMLAKAEKVYACAADYERLCLTVPKAPRQEAAKAVSALLREVQVADANMSMEVGYACNRSDGTMYGASRYAGNFTCMHRAYGDLASLLYELSHAWSGNCYFDDPSSQVDYWSGRVSVNSATGRMAYLEAYEADRAGARP